MHYFSLFFKKISKLCVKFLSVWTKNTIGLEIFEKILKIFDENSIEKFNFYLFLGKVVAKTTAFGNNIVFLQQFFRFGRGFEPPNPPPCARHWFVIVKLNTEKKNTWKYLLHGKQVKYV